MKSSSRLVAPLWLFHPMRPASSTPSILFFSAVSRKTKFASYELLFRRTGGAKEKDSWAEFAITISTVVSFSVRISSKYKHAIIMYFIVLSDNKIVAARRRISEFTHAPDIFSSQLRSILPSVRSYNPPLERNSHSRLGAGRREGGNQQRAGINTEIFSPRVSNDSRRFLSLADFPTDVRRTNACISVSLPRGSSGSTGAWKHAPTSIACQLAAARCSLHSDNAPSSYVNPRGALRNNVGASGKLMFRISRSRFSSSARVPAGLRSTSRTSR